MNFFKSLISDDPDPLYPENPQDSERDSAENQPLKDHDDDDNDENDVVSDADDQSAESSGGNMWGFGGLLQTLTTRSESVLEAYKRDLQEFGSGLKKETELFKEVASRAVKDLPASIEVAHGAIDGVIKSTADIISQGRETLLSHPSEDALPPETPERGISIGRYSRYEAQLYTIQNDENTFTEEPEDVEDYNKWKSGFVLTERIEEIEELIGENGALEDMHKRLVFTNEVNQDIFWFRYFYRVDKLKQQESVRANLVRRAISIEDDEEELSWDVDDDDEEDDDDENENEKEKEKEKESSQLKPKEDESDNKKESSDLKKDKNVEEESPKNVTVVEESEENKFNVEKEEEHEVKADESDKKVSINENSNKVEDKSDPNVSVGKESEETESNVENIDKANVVSSVEGDEKEKGKEKEKEKESSEVKNEDKMVESKESSEVEKSEGKSDQKSVAKESESEEDMGWDEIEDVSSSDEKKVSAPSKSVDPVDVKKRLSVAEEDDDEDLSWDIEDDDD